MVTKLACLRCDGRCKRSAFITCVLLLQEYERRVSLLSEMLLQQESAGDDTQELVEELTQRLPDNASEVSDLHQHQQGASSHMVCCNTYCLPNTCLFAYRDSKKQKLLRLLLMCFGCALFWLVQK